MSVATLIFKLPLEIRIHILNYATRSSKWALHMFFPPENDFKYVEGFANALPIFCRWVEEAQTLLLQLSLAVDGVKGILESKIPAKHIRHLRIQCNRTGTPTELVRFKNLESLSITPGQCETALHTMFRYQATSMAQSLRRLDFAWSNIRFLMSYLYVFPNLVEVRLAVSQPTIRTTEILDTKHFIMASLLDFNNQSHPNKCTMSLCGAAELDESARVKERYMTMKLAQNLPALKCVRWSVAFRSSAYFDEVGQREYVISRWEDGTLSIGGGNIIEES
ncbi:uncharacterized protein FOMMEDRAFT_149773 [Fomitiporia mediterranea MF3/22]|uniref:uncharacterized protein n=1 Tax=Fomitiporia mediterranea (strain MF3/22) TaxID=694068 RepID=UPI000440752F|nr:uncharacterized protein FOMMEDRAFT_149773 [Fomitiporia mediterranea MF3/22]EJD07259.1 hypothetical protein FOMMEDRAFT_149773 [Fomitiporia mediterranea MF3/22]